MQFYMRITFLFFVCFGFLDVLSAQEEQVSIYDFFTQSRQTGSFHDPYSIGDTAAIFGKDVNIRSKPDKSGKVVATLGPGALVVVKDTAGFSLVNGLDRRWYQVEYQAGGANQTGYVWGGLLALGKTELSGATVLFGAVAGKKSEEMVETQFEFRAYQKETLLSSAAYSFALSPESYVASAALPNLGLEYARGIMYVRIGYDACAYPSYMMYAIWDGKELIKLPEVTAVSDGGVFYHLEEYIFPALQPEYQREKQQILLKVENGSTLEDEDESDAYTKIRVVRRKGKVYTKPKVE